MSFGMLRALTRIVLLLSIGLPVFGQISINEILAENKNLISPDGSVSDWVELYNSAAQPVSISGYSLTDTLLTPRKWVVPANVTIPANGFLLILLDSSRPPSVDSGILLNTGFSIKGSGDQLALYDSNSQLVEKVEFGAQAANYSIGRVPAAVRSFVLCTPTPGSANIEQPLGPQNSIRINEWMASPSSGKDWFELYNPGTLPVELSGLYFTDDGNSPFHTAPFSFLGTDRYAFFRYNADGGTNTDEVNFKLSGSGDSISLFTGTGIVIDTVHFGQQGTDISQGRLPDGSTNIRSLSQATPGESNLIPFPGLVVNELLSHTDPPFEDAVEFYNQTSALIDISGWYLSNSRTDLKKFHVPNGTVVQPKGYLVFYEYQFNRTGDPGAFTFNSAHGDQVYLSQANSAGDLTGYIVSEIFEAIDHGISFGRYDTSVPGDYKFVAMDHLTFGGPENPATVEQFRTGQGASNSAPRVGPVVITEIMYHPPSTAVDGSDNVDDEFIELRNLTTDTVPLYDPLHPENSWRLQGGVALTFPAGSSLSSLGFAVVVSFGPDKNPDKVTAFRTKYAVPAGVQIFGGYSGKLNNGGDSVELYRPDTPQDPPHPDTGFVPYFRVDKVNYSGLSPWPTNGITSGQSLQRKNSTTFGNDPINWQTAPPSAGKPNFGEVTDADGDGMPDLWERRYGFDPANPADATADADGDGFTNLQEFLAGTDPRNPESRLSVQIVSPIGTSGTQLSFATVPGKSYAVQFRNDLLASSSWQKLINTNALGANVTVQDVGPSGNASRFYRVLTPAAD